MVAKNRSGSDLFACEPAMAAVGILFVITLGVDMGLERDPDRFSAESGLSGGIRKFS